jgi:predicted amidohydrolase
MTPATPARQFRLALVQLSVVGARPDINLSRAAEQVATAAARGAQVVLLPEALDAGWTHPQSRALASPVPDGQACQAFRTAARQNKVYVCAGFTERDGDRVYNAAVLVSPSGEILLRYRKLNELEIGHEVYDQGDRLGVVETPLGVMGLMICADAFVPGQFVGRTLGQMGADIILSPSAWAVPPGYDNVKQPYGGDWEHNYGEIAKSFRVWVAGCSNVGPVTGGPWKGYACIGRSVVVDPTGKVAAIGPYGEAAEAILTVDVNLVPRPARGTGWQSLQQGG